MSHTDEQKVPIASDNICTMTLSEDDVELFKKAIRKHYFYEFFADALPMHGFVGADSEPAGATETEEETYYLFLHLHFTFMYNDDQVIHVNTTADPRHVHVLSEGEWPWRLPTFSAWMSFCRLNLTPAPQDLRK